MKASRWLSGVTATLVLGLPAIPAYAATVAIGEQISNGNFTTNLNGWTTAGTAQWRSQTNDINTQGGSAGFNNFFSSGFATLGDVSGNITNQTWDVLSTISQSFTLNSTIGGDPVTAYDLTISFRTVFDGRDSPTTLHDIFSAVLITPSGTITLFSQDSSGFPDAAPATNLPNNQLMNNPFSAQLFGLAPGAYTLRFILDEKADPSEANFTNTAAGIDSVSITGTANVVPLPAAAWLLLSGLAGLGVLRRRKTV